MYNLNDCTDITITVRIELIPLLQVKVEYDAIYKGYQSHTYKNLPGEPKLILATIYLHQEVSQNDLVMFLTS